MATCTPQASEKTTLYSVVMGFLNGPDFYVTSSIDTEHDAGQAAQHQAENTVPTAQIVLSARSTADLQLQQTPESPRHIKVKDSSKQKGPTTEGFDNNKQIYTKEELSPLPFQPPVFLTYATSMLAGAFKVFQYMITIMVSLMMTQNAMERYWSSSGTSTTAMQKFLLALFLSYPLITLLLVILSNNEIAIRRFMYYRLMSLQVIVDWHNTPFYKLWFFTYFVMSFILINVYALYAGVITRNDKTTSVFPQWSIMVMQSVLLFMFWLNMVSMEDQLVPLNKVIENSPESAKELITLCDVVKEAQLKAVVKQSYRRKRVFKHMTEADQDAAGRQLIETGDSVAAFFDLNALRSTSKRRNTQEDLTTVEDEYDGCWCMWLHDLKEWFEDLTFRKLYAWYFCLSFFSTSLLKLRRSGKDRAAATIWPYPGDIKYFWALGTVGSLCFITVVMVEAYAVWFLLFATDITDRNTYGITECKQCYTYLSMAGETCSQQLAGDKCWSVGVRGYCEVQHALVNSYNWTTGQVTELDSLTCAQYLP